MPGLDAFTRLSCTSAHQTHASLMVLRSRSLAVARFPSLSSGFVSLRSSVTCHVCPYNRPQRSLRVVTAPDAFTPRTMGICTSFPKCQGCCCYQQTRFLVAQATEYIHAWIGSIGAHAPRPSQPRQPHYGHAATPVVTHLSQSWQAARACGLRVSRLAASTQRSSWRTAPWQRS